MTTKTSTTKSWSRRLALAAAVALAAVPALAQGFPTRPITLIVPFAAGGPSDAIARLLGQSMAATLGQPVVIETVAGAGGTTGAARLAKAEPDGYTLLIHHVALPASASLYKDLSYDTLTAFDTLGLVNQGPMMIVARKAYSASTVAELVAKVRADGDKTTVAHAGIGSNAHLCLLLLQRAFGIKVTDVAYRGTGPAMNDVVGGQVDLLCDQSTNAVPQVQGGTVKAYAVTSSARLDVVRDVPTLKESGFPDFEFVIWHGLYAPRGTPAPVRAALEGALRKALADPTIRIRFAEVGTAVFPEGQAGPEAHRARFEREVAAWREVVGREGAR